MNIPNSLKAFKWMNLAANTNYPNALHNIGWWYDHGFGHIKEDNDKALDHTLVSHLSVEPGHKMLTEFIKKPPLLNLEMRLGEASGAAVALLIVKAALATHNGMATFDQAGVSSNE